MYGAKYRAILEENLLAAAKELRVGFKRLECGELQMRLNSLDPLMESEIEEIHQKYQAKRQPILDAIDSKKRRQQNL
ncbi:unnamed protein product [Ranitomeya imitator]|uniref:SARAH domain-containing protein n=1 Tax=Ranitomeya imitator TaxID=111125 RepID=A0ABN9LS51_9NEOB|nr:unnamed protein product [Ranitomeya imitator]